MNLSTIKIVSLAPSVTETLCAIGFGHALVARTDFCDWPVTVADIPSVGGFSNCCAEAILSFHPDLVIGTSLHKPLLQQIGLSGVRTACLKFHAVYEAPHAIRFIGELVNGSYNANLLASQLEVQIHSIKEQAKTLGSRRVCYLCNIECPSWFSCPVAASVGFLGCTNAGRNKFLHAKNNNMISMITRDKPELFLISKCKKCRSLCIDNLFENVSEFKKYLDEYVPETIHFSSKLLGRAGPRAGFALNQLAHAIYGKDWDIGICQQERLIYS
ncbi:helical backbone metal receptor [Chitinispirillales bacterium ANBcel5]|uniref:helical backbone metal receptor n=1 Tax=Cellulosispirillum alkaliphilum TaxID=3039283 RepID=UPI002A553483|nr:helical backbone metal receptor [Chitinispirillales bacterium ANBcel5]